MEEAARGFPCSPDQIYQKACKIALLEIEKSKASLPRFPKGIQTIILHSLRESVFPDTLPILIRARFSSLSPASPTLPTNFDFDTLKEQLQSLPRYAGFVVARAWANG